MDSIFVIKPESVRILRADSKDDVLLQLSALLAEAYALDAQEVHEHLDEREKLGSTGFGRGVAIPHARLPDLNRPVAALIKLERAVDFDAADGLPVDLVFGLLSPSSSGATHLHALAAISRLMRDDVLREALSDAPDAEALYSLLSNVTDRDAA